MISRSTADRRVARPSTFDVLMAVGLFLASAAEILLTRDLDGRAVAMTVAAISATALVWRRVAPLPIAVVVVTAEMLQFWLGVPPDGLTLPLLAVIIAMYTLGSRATLRQSVLGGLGGLVGIWSVVIVHARLLGTDRVEPGDVLWSTMMVLAPLVLGGALSSTKDDARRTVELAESEQAAATAAALAEERARIARELHDIVSHSISAMAVQTSAVRHLLPRGSELSDALQTVEDTGREALEEMHRLLAMVRSSNVEHQSELSPQPGLARLGEVVDRVRASGLDVSLRIEGDASLPAGLDLAAYRIVQEALTNVQRHASATHADVLVCRQPDAVRIVVSNDGPAPSSPVRPGHGLIGMRERVGLYGGSLSAGPGDEGGFVVRAALPTIEHR